ncbi:MAG: hypothetical protein ACRDD1_10835 [Planctomycetia bacterium]
MVAWLNKRLFGGSGAAVVETPALLYTRCLCGAEIEGLRRKFSQIVACPECAASVFLLPRSPLPEPGAVPEKKASEKFKKRKLSAEIEAAAVAPPRPRLSQRLGGALAAWRRSTVEQAVAFRQWWTTPRLVFAGVLAVAVATGGWQWRQAENRRLAELLLPSGRQGLRLLAERKLPEAGDAMKTAIRAMQRLEVDPPEGKRFRRAYEELSLAKDLWNVPLDEAIVGGTTSIEIVNKRLKGRVVVVDAVVAPAATGGGWTIGWTPFCDDKPTPFEAAAVPLFDTLGIQKPTRVLFMVRLEGLAPNATDGLTLKLDGASATLLTEQGIFEAFALDHDPEASKIRQRQRTLVAVDDVPEEPVDPKKTPKAGGKA